MKRVGLIGIFVFMVVAIQAQSVDRHMVGAAGFSVKAGNYELSSSLGEVAIEGVTVGNFVITQGFQQSDDKEMYISVEEVGLNVAYSLYPNPVEDNLVLELRSTSAIQNQLLIRLINVEGKEMDQRKSVLINMYSKISFDLSGMYSGQYYIVIQDEDTQQLKVLPILKK